MVRVSLSGEQNWSLATCAKQVGPRSYEVLCGDRKYRRNQRDLRKTPEYQSDSLKKELSTSIEGRQLVLSPENSSPVCAPGHVPTIEDNEQPRLRRSTRVRESAERFPIYSETCRELYSLPFRQCARSMVSKNQDRRRRFSAHGAKDIANLEQCVWG